jgi:flagellar biosynthesis protein FlhF
MKIKRFFATDIRQAMRMVKEELGADAVIMSNRAVDGGIEIVAARDFDEQSIHTKLQEQAAVQAPEPIVKNVVFPLDETKKPLQAAHNQKADDTAAIAKQPSVAQNLADKPQEQPIAKVSDLHLKRGVLPNFEAAKKRLQLENERKNAAALAATQPARKFTSPYVGYAEKTQLIRAAESETNAVTPAPAIKKEVLTNFITQDQQPTASDTSLLMEMNKELKQLRSAMDAKFANISWALNPQGSSPRNDLLQRLTNMGISKRLGNALFNQLTEENNAELAFVKAQEMLSQAMPIANDNLLETGGIVALVGPTGVGKTTTIAKLAAKFILKHGSNQVALITTDNYRIGAHDQLNTYGRILNVPVRVASCGDDLKNIINSFANKRLILIDTAGMCQRDMKLVEQINTLQQNDLPIRSYLVMSAATEYKAMKEVIKAFSVFEPQAAILTKLDEAVMIGSAISSIIEHNLPLAFIADGQQVPEDFHSANARALIEQCVVEAEAEADLDDELGYQPWGAQAYA